MLATFPVKIKSSQKFYFILCLIVTSGWSSSTATADPTSIEVALDGVTVTYTPGSTIVVPSSTGQIFFHVGGPAGTANSKLARIRYRLEDIDTDWHQRDGTMSFDLYFYDRNGEKIGQQICEAKGKSSGWNESIEKSTFTHRRETCTVPPLADTLLIVITSAGPEDSVGIYVVEDVLVTGRVPAKELAESLLDSSPLSQTDKDAPQGMFKWTVDGNRPSMAKMFNLHGSESSTKAFCIIDNDPIAHADWDSSKVSVTPGEHLTVEWNEMYNSGRSDDSYIQYGPLPVGHYRFRVQEVDAWDHALGIENSVELMVPLPYWKSPWFLASCTGIAAILLIWGGRYWVHANIRRHLQRTRWVEQERLRIARDLHDDLGARLAHLSLMSAQAERETASSDARTSFREITGMARELASTLSEVVWTVNPENDHLESLVSFLCHLIHSSCEPSLISCRIDALGKIDERSVPSAIRHHVCLAVKEAVNNILKHSDATELRASIRFDAPLLTISLADNGKGFEEGRTKQGNGIANMRHRMAMVKGRVMMESLEGKGTTICFEVPIP